MMTVGELIDLLEDVPSDTVVKLEVGPGSNYYTAYGKATGIEFREDAEDVYIVAEEGD